MKHIFAAGLLGLAGLIAIPAALAAPIVATGSTYSLFYRGTDTGNANNVTTIFDNNPNFFLRDGLHLVVTESDTDQGNGVNLITVNLRSDGNLFPSAQDDSDYGLGVADFDGLDLLRLVSLTAATLDLYNLDNNLFATIDLGVPPGTSDPWDGIYPFFGSVAEIGSAGIGISGFSFHFTVAGQPDTPPPAGVPEPGSVMLFAAGMAACAAWRRRKSAV